MRDIEGFEGLYAITSCGKVWSYKRQKFLIGWISGNGYHCVKLRKNNKTYGKRVHILVAEAYLERPTDNRKYDVGHLDDCPSHNWVGNLKWMTRNENLNTAHFREKQLKKYFNKILCVETGEVFNTQREAAEALNIHPYGINNVLLGKQKTAGGYHWERLDEKTDRSLWKKN